jgi:hypothetical protein
VETDLRGYCSLAFPPLIRPFNYQSVIIPMLPSKMESFLEAPVPFVVGTVRLPDHIPDDVVILDVLEDEVRSAEVIADLPQLEELYPSKSLWPIPPSLSPFSSPFPP